METILKTENLCKYYGKGENEVRAVRSADIAIKQGEFTAIVGKSGSGKSTLLHLLGGLDYPTSGKVWVKDKDIFSMKEEELAVFRRRNIGFVFQAFNLVSSVNVWENIVLPIGLDGREADVGFAEDIIKTLGMEHKIHNLPNTLSGGQQQRVAIARALASQNQVILADEPTGNLDEATAKEITSIFKDTAHDYDRCVIIVSHSKEVAKEADIVYELKGGKLTQISIAPN